MENQPFQFGILRWFVAISAAAIPFAIFSNETFESQVLNSINGMVFFAIALIVQKNQVKPLIRSSACGIGLGILGIAFCGIVGGILGFAFGFLYYSKDQNVSPVPEPDASDLPPEV